MRRSTGTIGCGRVVCHTGGKTKKEGGKRRRQSHGKGRVGGTSHGKGRVKGIEVKVVREVEVEVGRTALEGTSRPLVSS